MCPSFEWIFYERDKNAAHKDSNYVYKTNISLSDVIVKMKKAIKTVQSVCSNVISDKAEYKYYAYDSLLFRYVNGITPKVEEAFNDSILLNNR